MSLSNNDLDMQDVSSPVDRWWLAELPPVEIFNDDVKWLAIDSDNDFIVSTHEMKVNPTGKYWLDIANGVNDTLYMLKTPKLTGEEWKHSLIHIDELAEFQTENEK